MSFRTAMMIAGKVTVINEDPEKRVEMAMTQKESPQTETDGPPYQGTEELEVLAGVHLTLCAVHLRQARACITARGNSTVLLTSGPNGHPKLSLLKVVVCGQASVTLEANVTLLDYKVVPSARLVCRGSVEVLKASGSSIGAVDIWGLVSTIARASIVPTFS